jgi:hypothetical protein
VGQDGGGYKFESGRAGKGIFFAKGLDRLLGDLPVGQITSIRFNKSPRPRGEFLRLMAGLVPAIHVFCFARGKTWMPGSSPGMTMAALIGGNFGRAQAATHSAVMPGLDPGIPSNKWVSRRGWIAG